MKISLNFVFTKPANFSVHLFCKHVYIFLSMNFKVYKNYYNGFLLFLIRIRNIKWQWFTSVNNFSLSIIKLRIQACSFIYTWIYRRKGRSCLAISQRRYRSLFCTWQRSKIYSLQVLWMNAFQKKLYRRSSYSYTLHTHERLNFPFFIHDFSFLLQ